ncbi:Uma2 family endonuclease [Methylobacterium sp. WCS2018Hpa-22]|uniref:Uma2 family endonuclease n=1 Tax=Methylobacterium sp. WCS2018Hpa-22 TaxID=3073633 RepID=UPI00288B37CC|nr:Uma2 family endonuclease [Methylobacterium sp. WCS2018Hpa-22]
MAVAARRDTRMTVAEFRLWAEPRPDEERWELIDGIALLMSPPTGRHQRIVSNLIRRLDELAERRGRNALPGLGVLSAAMDEVRVEAWRRTEAGNWTVEALYRDDSLDLPELGGAVPVGALYTGLPL